MYKINLKQDSILKLDSKSLEEEIMLTGSQLYIYSITLNYILIQSFRKIYENFLFKIQKVELSFGKVNKILSEWI